jgi:hypothetical protein
MSALLASLLILASNGCRTAPPMAPVDLEAHGWAVLRGQAVWQPKSGAPELAGSLLIASSLSGEDFIHFSKEPMDIVLARRNNQGWQLNIPVFHKSYAYRGQPPRRIGWFQLAHALNHEPTTGDWEWSGVVEGRWLLCNPKTGERLEGFFSK